ncbi:MAG: ribonuclease P protein component [candidate division Zixibacteria bacterium]|nr:ribonuclease P protein component [candidate division Zixibacteria bacterium]
MRNTKQYGFPKRIHIKSRKEFAKVRYKGEYKKSDSFLLSVYTEKRQQTTKFGINLRKGFKSAVERNRVKRVIREVLRHNKKTFPEGSLVLTIAKPNTAQLKNSEIRAELKSLFELTNRDD